MNESIKKAVSIVILLWVVFLIDTLLGLHLTRFGIVPRSIQGLLGIFTAPFLHGGFFHLLSNSVPIFVLSTATFYFYKKEAPGVFLKSIILGGGLVWLFARSANHIGISGLIYSLALFLIVTGFIKKDIKSIIVSAGILFMYGGLIWGVFPGRVSVSWEGHLFGAIAGGIIAYTTFKNNKTL
ncbi:MAG: rhomboid family intramembrane serine protease [Flavobacteriaceae bacterium]|nr:MAG: rhomboid family intramembrane serine protease [Flavobacteriaceae bacterium]